MRRVVAAFVLAAAAITGPFGSAAHADPLTAGQLMVRCGKLDVSDNQVKLRSAGIGDALDAGKCWGHLEAYLDLASIELPGAGSNASHPLGACPPYGTINFTQVAQMFLSHARAHPEEQRKPAALVIANLLAEKYPCRKAQ